MMSANDVKYNSKLKQKEDGQWKERLQIKHSIKTIMSCCSSVAAVGFYILLIRQDVSFF